MRKRQWMAEVYGFICSHYIKGKPENIKEKTEKILFLMQYESLHTGEKKPFIPYKIYIDGINIRVRYIHDILCVRKVMTNFARGGGKAFPSWRGMKDILKYDKIFNKYAKESVEGIAERVQFILDNKDLDSKYFVFCKYEDKNSRRLARLWSRQEESFSKWISWFILTVIALPLLFCVFVIFYASVRYTVENLMIKILVYLSLLIVIDTPWFIWTWNWMNQPTQFELENGYDKG